MSDIISIRNFEKESVVTGLVKIIRIRKDSIKDYVDTDEYYPIIYRRGYYIFPSRNIDMHDIVVSDASMDSLFKTLSYYVVFDKIKASEYCVIKNEIYLRRYAVELL